MCLACRVTPSYRERPVHIRYIPPREANAEFMHAERMYVLYDPRMFCNSVQDKILWIHCRNFMVCHKTDYIIKHCINNMCSHSSNYNPLAQTAHFIPALLSVCIPISSHSHSGLFLYPLSPRMPVSSHLHKQLPSHTLKHSSILSPPRHPQTPISSRCILCLFACLLIVCLNGHWNEWL